MQNEMTPELLATLSPEKQAAWDRCQKATPGPWVSGVGSWNKSSWKHKAPLTCAAGTLANFLVQNTGDASSDGEFTAHARQDLPSALLELAQTKEQLEAQREIAAIYQRGQQNACDQLATVTAERDAAIRSWRNSEDEASAAMTSLRARLAEVTGDRDRLRESLKAASHALGMVGHGATGNQRWMSHDPSIRQHCLNAEMAANAALSAPEPKPEAPKCEPVEFHMNGLRMAKCKNCGRENYAHPSCWQTECNGTGRAQ